MEADGGTNRSGKLVVLSGPSGVGKSTICRQVVRQLGASLSVSATTRPRGRREVHGRDYWFLTREQFEEKIRRGEFLEYAEVFGNLYGTPADAVRRQLAEGKTVILEIDIQGGRAVRTMFPEALLLFILPPDEKVLAERIEGRKRGEDPETLRRRLDAAEREIEEARGFYTKMIVNDDLEKAVQEVVEAISQ
ncbi:MAG: guanylate kinase [Phycisphaerae bacterium]|nr:guanylate kinase [Phycisphaerae bacterium]